MRAILVDPYNRQIKEVDMTEDFREIYKLLSTEEIPVNCFGSGMTWNNGDMLYVDDEGLLKAGCAMFCIGRSDGSPLAGMGLIQGSDREGGSVDAKTPLREIEELVRWTDFITGLAVRV